MPRSSPPANYGYGKRTPFGPNAAAPPEGEVSDDRRGSRRRRVCRGVPKKKPKAEGSSSSFRYRTQRRGGKGLRDIKTTDRNGPVIGIVPVNDDDELMMMTARGKIQRVKVSDFNVIGRNTQGVRIMTPRRRRHPRRHRPRPTRRT